MLIDILLISCLIITVLILVEVAVNELGDLL